MSGSSPTATPVQVSPPVYPPGFAFSKGFFDQIAPQLINSPYPRFQGSVDPGLSPTMAALIRGGQTYASTPFSSGFQQAASTLGGMMNVNYENPMASVAPNRYGFDYAPADFRSQAQSPPLGMPTSMANAAQSMGNPMGAPPGGKQPGGG